MKITFKRLKEPMPQDDTSEASIDVPHRRRSQHKHVNTIPNPTDSDEEIDTTLPSQVPWEGEFIPARRPTIGGKTLTPRNEGAAFSRSG